MTCSFQSYFFFSSELASSPDSFFISFLSCACRRALLDGAGVYDRPQVGLPGVFAFPPTGWPRSRMFSHLPQCCYSCAFTIAPRFRVESLCCATPQARRKWATAIFGGGVRAFQSRNSIVLKVGCRFVAQHLFFGRRFRSRRSGSCSACVSLLRLCRGRGKGGS